MGTLALLLLATNTTLAQSVYFVSTSSYSPLRRAVRVGFLQEPKPEGARVGFSPTTHDVIVLTAHNVAGFPPRRPAPFSRANDTVLISLSLFAGDSARGASSRSDFLSLASTNIY